MRDPAEAHDGKPDLILDLHGWTISGVVERWPSPNSSGALPERGSTRNKRCRLALAVRATEPLISDRRVIESSQFFDVSKHLVDCA